MKKYRVLMAHNLYREFGGENISFANEVALLRDHGHEVETLTKDSGSLATELSSAAKMKTAASSIWSRSIYREFDRAIKKFRPDVVHFQNTFPLLSPSAYYACKDNGAAVVQHLRNYRLVCPSSTGLLRDGNICRDCIDKSLLSCVKHKCYRESRSQSLVISSMVGIHRRLGTWDRSVDRYIVLSDFSRDILAERVPREKLFVRPNFLAKDPGKKEGDRKGFLYCGRLTHEKGIRWIVNHWPKEFELQILGKGPDEAWLKDKIRDPSFQHIKFLGSCKSEEVTEYMAKAEATVVPSLLYETFGRTVMESFAVGTPVIASDLGPLASLVQDGKNGVLIPPGEENSFAKGLERWQNFANHDDLRHEARAAYERDFSAESCYQSLVQVYDEASGVQVS